jgi:hypothetical protein
MVMAEEAAEAVEVAEEAVFVKKIEMLICKIILHKNLMMLSLI